MASPESPQYHAHFLQPEMIGTVR